jgi:hypothetical protein
VRVNATVVIDKHDRPTVTHLEEHDCLEVDGNDEPWMAIDVGEGVSIIGPRDQIARWTADLHAAVGMS